MADLGFEPKLSDSKAIALAPKAHRFIVIISTALQEGSTHTDFSGRVQQVFGKRRCLRKIFKASGFSQVNIFSGAHCTCRVERIRDTFQEV